MAQFEYIKTEVVASFVPFCNDPHKIQCSILIRFMTLRWLQQLDFSLISAARIWDLLRGKQKERFDLMSPVGVFVLKELFKLQDTHIPHHSASPATSRPRTVLHTPAGPVSVYQARICVFCLQWTVDFVFSATTWTFLQLHPEEAALTGGEELLASRGGARADNLNYWTFFVWFFFGGGSEKQDLKDKK